jgi:putative transposase
MVRVLNNNYHSVYRLKYHLVVITKYRHECTTSEMLKELEKILPDYSRTKIVMF